MVRGGEGRRESKGEKREEGRGRGEWKREGGEERGGKGEEEGRREEKGRREDETGGRLAQHHTDKQYTPRHATWISMRHGTHKHTHTRVIYPSSWWDSVPFPLLYLHLITLAMNSSHLADRHI